jgi:hypothetical protein
VGLLLSLLTVGIEWLNDTTLLLLFPSASASLLALTLLSKAGFDPAEGDDPLFERSAHPIPIALLAHIDIKPVESKAGEELLGVKTEHNAEGVQRKGRGGFQSGIMADVVEAATPTWELEEGVDPNARVTVRFAVQGDKDVRQAAKDSEWYARHGRKAGKEQSTTSRRPGPYNRPAYEDEEAGWVGEGGEGRDLGRRIGRGGRRAGRDGGRATQTLDDLDRELEGLKGGDSGRRRGGGRSRGVKGEGRPTRDKDDLDKGTSIN